MLVLLGYLLATLAFTWPLALHFTTAIPGDSFDGWQNYWNLWWLKQALVEWLVWPLHTDMLYAPTGVNLYFHTLNPFNGLAALPIQLAGGLMPAYNAVVMLSWVLGGYGMFLLARWVIARRGPAADAAAFLGGLVYTLSPFHMAHLLGHMQVMSLQWLPFYILYLLRGIKQSRKGRGWLRSALLAGLFLILNGLCDWYFVLYLFLFTGLAVLWEWAAALAEGGTPRGRATFGLRSLWQTVRPPLAAGAVFALVLSPWLLPMIAEARAFRFMVRPPADLYLLSASLMDFLVPNRLHTLFRPGSFTWIGNQVAPISERTIAIGYVPLALAALAAAWTWRKAAFWLVTGGFFLLLALGPQWHVGDITAASVPPAVQAGEEVTSWTPYALLNRLVPFMRISRSVSRFALMVQLSAAVLAGLGLHALLGRAAGRWSRAGSRRGAGLAAGAVFGATAGLLLAEYWVAPYPLSPPDTPAYYAQLAVEDDARSVLNLPMNYDRPGYLLYQTVHGKPLAVAYISRDDPRTLTERVPVLQHFRHLGDDILAGDPAAAAPAVWADLGVGTVVLDRYKMPGGLEREYTEALAARIFAGQAPVYEDERITVYRVEDYAAGAPAAAPAGTPGDAAGLAPYLRLGPQNWGPRQVDASGAPRRNLTGGPAAVEVLHARTPVQVMLRYRTEGSLGAGAAGEPVALTVTTLDGSTVLRELPPAPDGAEVTIDLPLAAGLLLQPALPAPSTAADPAAAPKVYVEQLRLEP